MRDDYRRRWRRARALGFGTTYANEAGDQVVRGCCVDRWDNDSKDNFRFRIDLQSKGWTREDLILVDETAESEGKEPPRKKPRTTRENRGQVLQG